MHFPIHVLADCVFSHREQYRHRLSEHLGTDVLMWLSGCRRVVKDTGSNKSGKKRKQATLP